MGTTKKKDTYQDKDMTFGIKAYNQDGKKFLVAKFPFNLTHFIDSDNSPISFLTPCKTVELAMNITIHKKGEKIKRSNFFKGNKKDDKITEANR